MFQRQNAVADSADQLDWFEALDNPPHAWISSTLRDDRAGTRQALLDLIAAVEPAASPPGQ